MRNKTPKISLQSIFFKLLEELKAGLEIHVFGVPRKVERNFFPRVHLVDFGVQLLQKDIEIVLLSRNPIDHFEGIGREQELVEFLNDIPVVILSGLLVEEIQVGVLVEERVLIRQTCDLCGGFSAVCLLYLKSGKQLLQVLLREVFWQADF